MNEHTLLGIDIGGTGIKGALVDVKAGCLVTERFRLSTPQPAHKQAITTTFCQVVKHFAWQGIIGCGFPAVIKNGHSLTAVNIHKDWISANVEDMLSTSSDCTVKVCNDADAGGIAEMRFGKGKGQQGVVLFVTIGTGIGSALFVNGKLVPNTELGQLFLKNHQEIVERYAAASARKREELSWEHWAARFNEFLAMAYTLFTPDLILLGGGISKKFENYGHVLKSPARLEPAALRNEAGIIGAAMYAYELQHAPVKHS